MPPVLPQVLCRKSYRGHLDWIVYAVRPDAIGKRIKTADEIRQVVGLEPNQRIVALLFDTDEWLEYLYRREMLERLAAAKYDLIVAPSFSLWWNRPRLHHLYNLSRSLAVCVALQQLGAPAVPRVDWDHDSDLDRWAKWLNNHPTTIELIAIDAMASDKGSWNQVLHGIERLQTSTGYRLRYLINGPSVFERWQQLYGLIDYANLTLTDASLPTSRPTPEEDLTFRGSSEETRGPRHSSRVWRRERELVEAATAAGRTILKREAA